MPTQNNIEMGMHSIVELVNKIGSIPGYRPYFRAAFGDATVTAARMRLCLVAFLATIQSDDAPADRLAQIVGRRLTAEGSHEEALSTPCRPLPTALAISESAVRGWLTFEAHCTSCHRPDTDWRDDVAHNTGISARSASSDRGRGKITANPADDFAWATPTLRNVIHTAPYMHDGSLATLDDVVTYYNDGGVYVRGGRFERGRGVDRLL